MPTVKNMRARKQREMGEEESVLGRRRVMAVQVIKAWIRVRMMTCIISKCRSSGRIHHMYPLADAATHLVGKGSDQQLVAGIAGKNCCRDEAIIPSEQGRDYEQ